MSSIDLTRQILTALPLDLGKPWGEIATQWQIDDARAVLDPDHPQRLHWLGRPKGASKSTDIAAILIVWLLTQARPGEEGVVAAADEDQANRLLDRARGFVHRSRALKGRITVQRRAILGPDGARVTALSADAPSTEGILTPFAIIEELPNWPETDNAKAMWTAIFSSVPKDPRMRLVVIGHAGAPEHWSYRILERARQSKRWRVNEIPGPLEWISEDDLEEQRHQLREAAFNRRHLNIWTHAEDRLVDPAALRDAVTLDGPLVPVAGVRYVLGVDLGFRHDRSVVSICHSEPVEDRPPARRVVLDRMIVFEGTRADEVRLRDVEQAIVQAWSEYGRPRIRLDIWQAVGLKQRLEARGVRIEEFTFSPQNNARLAGTLDMLFRDRLLALPPDEELLSELARIRLRETAVGTLRIDHSSGEHDDRAIALSLAATALVEEGMPMPATFASPRSLRLPSRFGQLPSVAGRRPGGG